MRYPRIRDLREDHDLTQTQVAHILEMSQTGYSKYENVCPQCGFTYDD